ncbi:MAG: hypothetical protein FVQ81_15555 [Candidatus Glassbacteria bacterium]|nr:hypothetical protein [Candidatus Glassbacteria bacterium]
MLRNFRKIVLFVFLLLGAIAGYHYVYAQNFLDTKPTMQFSIPQNFGLLVTIYQQGANTVFWFEAEDGTFRRVLLDGQGQFELEVWAITRQ